MQNRGRKVNSYTNNGWGLDSFTHDDIIAVHHASLELFQDVGVMIESEAAAEIFYSSKCRVEKKEGSWFIRIPPYVVENCIQMAPSQVVLKGRTPAYDYAVEPKAVSFTTFGECTKIIDIDTRKVRNTTHKDAQEIARLCDSIDDIKIIHRPVASLDKPLGTHPIYNAQALFSNTFKHINIGPINSRNLKFIAKMASAHLGGEKFFADRPIFTTIICPSSPLRLEKEAANMVIESAKLDGGGIVSHPVPLAGATNPMTLAGVMVNQNVEALTALILAQLVRPGTRTLFGTVSTVMDMRHLTTPFGAPELGMLSVAAVKMAQYYHLPSIVPGSHSSSKALDPQIGYESAITGMLPAMAGANFVYGLGTMEDALTYDHAKLMMDVELARMITYALGGISVTEASMAVEITRKIGPGGDFISSDHTRKHMREYFQPALFDRNMRDAWNNLEVKDLIEKAYVAARKRIDSHPPPFVPPEVEKEIETIIRAYLAEMGITQ